MRRYLLLSSMVCLGILFLFNSCDRDDAEPTPDFTFTKIGLNNLKVYELFLYHDDMLYAATNDGVYVKQIGAPAPFTLVGLKGRNVLDIVVFSREHIVASTGNRGFSEDTPGIFETVNGGTMWNSYTFGDGMHPETANSLSLDPIQSDVMYATGGAAIARSVDYGKNWEVIWGDWGGFASGTAIAEVNPFQNSDMWFGGQGGIENGYLGLLRNGLEVKQWTDLVDNPTVAVELAFTNAGDENIFVGFEGALMKTSNNGTDWQQVIDGHVDGLRFFYGIGSSDNQKRVYAGGWLKGVDEQPLILYTSNNSGESWEMNTFDSELSGGIFDMKVKSDTASDKVFVGLDGGGVYEIEVRF